MEKISISLDEELLREIERIQRDTGQQTDDVIAMGMKVYIKNYGKFPSRENTSVISETIYQQIPSNVEFDHTIPDHMLVKEKLVMAQSHNDHSYITKGLVAMMQNKIFPVILVIDELKTIQEDVDKNDWINLDWFKERALIRAEKFSGELKGRFAEKFQTGLPTNAYKLERSMKRGWSSQRRENEKTEKRQKGRKRFTTNFIAKVDFSKSKETERLYGAPGTWKLIEVKISKGSGRAGAEWVRLTERGKIFTKMFKIPHVAMINSGTGVIFTKDNVQWLIKTIFVEYPLEYKAMKMMLDNPKFGDSNKKGSEVLAEEFYKLQKEYLQDEMKKELSAEHDSQTRQQIEDGYKKAIEGLAGMNLSTKTRKGGKKKFVEYEIPKSRANAVMNRLQEMGLFVLKDRLFYERTELGKDVIEMGC